jgi:hypothetical protein
MDIEREAKVRDAIKYCIDNFDSQTATNRIVEFWKDELKLQEWQLQLAHVLGQSERLNCEHEWKVEAFDCYGMPYEQYCEHCGKKEAI